MAYTLNIGYEDGTDTSGVAPKPVEAHPDRVQASQAYAREGNWSLRTELRYGDTTAVGVRSESRLFGHDAFDGQWSAQPDVKRFYAFSILIDPENHPYDRIGDVLFQLKNTSGGPAIVVMSDEGRFKAIYHNVDVHKKEVHIEKYKPGEWYDFILEMKPTLKADGEMKLYFKHASDSEYTTVLDHTGPNLNNGNNAYIKWGVYKANWAHGPTGSDIRTVYHDSIRIGETFDDVALGAISGSGSSADNPPVGPVIIVRNPDQGSSPEPTQSREHFVFEGQYSVLRGTPEDLDNDTFSNFGAGKKLILEGVELGRSNILFTSNSEIEIDTDGDGEVDVTVSLTEGRSGGDIFASASGGNTNISYAKYLPDLSDGDRVDGSDINGIVNKDFLAGDGATDFRIELNDIGHAGYNNVLGVYDILDNGEITNVRLLYDNTNRDTGAVTINDVADGVRLGFFIVQNAADWARSVSNSDVLEFRSSEGVIADVDDQFDLILTLNGSQVRETTFHAENASLNVDDVQHALSGIVEGGDSMIIGFEDLTGGGDQDYEDVVFTVTHIEDDALAFV